MSSTGFTMERVANIMTNFIKEQQNNLKTKRAEVPWLKDYIENTNQDQRVYNLN